METYILTSSSFCQDITQFSYGLNPDGKSKIPTDALFDKCKSIKTWRTAAIWDWFFEKNEKSVGLSLEEIICC